MTFEDIKNISDEEFINILKEYIPEETLDQIYNNKLTRYEKKAYKAIIIVLGLLLGTVSVETFDSLLKENISPEITSGILLGSMLLSYMTINKLKNKEFNIRKDKFNEELIDLKSDICNLSEEEFNILVFSYEYITHNDLIEDNINLNVLEVINKLLSINAIDVLKEFEIENNESKLSTYYEDKKENPIKTYIKGN